jgi:hypothetical protein
MPDESHGEFKSLADNVAKLAEATKLQQAQLAEVLFAQREMQSQREGLKPKPSWLAWAALVLALIPNMGTVFRWSGSTDAGLSSTREMIDMKSELLTVKLDTIKGQLESLTNSQTAANKQTTDDLTLLRARVDRLSERITALENK